jgi:hypothetical protein
MSEFLLLYDVARTTKSTDDVLLSFLESTSKKTKTRAKLSLFVVFVSAVFWLIQGFTLYYEVGECANYYLIFVACTSPLFAFTIILS